MVILNLEAERAERPESQSTESRDWIGGLRDELDTYYASMRAFGDMDVAEVLMRLAAMGARGAELRGQVVRQDTRRASSFRTRELEPFLEQCEFQFRVWSRLTAIRELEFKLSGGGV